jgi:predicted acyl esterase
MKNETGGIYMIIERDLPIKMDDGVTLRVDVYRPDTTVFLREKFSAWLGLFIKY